MVRKLITALALSSGLFFASSCDFSSLDGLDTFPTILERAEASVNLQSVLEDAGFGSGIEVSRLEQVTSPTDGASYVLMLVRENERQRLLVLRAKDLSFVRIEENSAFDEFLGGDVQGRFLCGTAAFSSGATASTVDAGLVTALGNFDSHQSLASIGAGGYNAMLGVSGSNITLLDYTTPYSWATFNQYIAPISDGNYTFLDAVRGDGAGDTIRLLFDRDKRLIVAKFDSLAALRTAITNGGLPGNYFIPQSSTVSGPYYDGNYAWLTRTGIVTADNDKKELTYYPFSNLTKEQVLSVNKKYENPFISVDPSGNRWFLFDPKSSLLYALRTWW